jgi:small multidrug resistance pump
MNSWWWLLTAILFEVTATMSLKAYSLSSKIFPGLMAVLFYFISFLCLAVTLKKIEVGIAYAVWSGLGTVLITILGITFFGESFSMMKMIFIFLIIVGAVGLNLLTSSHA